MAPPPPERASRYLGLSRAISRHLTQRPPQVHRYLLLLIMPGNGNSATIKQRETHAVISTCRVHLSTIDFTSYCAVPRPQCKAMPQVGLRPTAAAVDVTFFLISRQQSPVIFLAGGPWCHPRRAPRANHTQQCHGATHVVMCTSY